MITINEQEINWRKGMTIRDAMNKMNYTFRLVIVYVNGIMIDKDKLDEHKLKDGDIIKVIHMESGG